MVGEVAMLAVRGLLLSCSCGEGKYVMGRDALERQRRTKEMYGGNIAGAGEMKRSFDHSYTRAERAAHRQPVNSTRCKHAQSLNFRSKGRLLTLYLCYAAACVRVLPLLTD
jgi:hypothetical protein